MQGIDVSYSDQVGFLTKGDRDWEDWIMQLLLMAKKEIGKDNAQEMSINFVDEDRSQAINRDYRDKDRPTDVISFAIEDGDDGLFWPCSPRTRTLLKTSATCLCAQVSSSATARNMAPALTGNLATRSCMATCT